MRRIKRPYDRQKFFAEHPEATGLIKIGWKVPSKNGERPTRLPGFLICTGSVDTDGKPQIDYPLMKKYNCDQGYVDGILERIKKSQKDANYPRFGELPTDLYIAIGYDAVMKNGQWQYPKTYVEDYLLYTKQGLFCRGNGDRAVRRMDDGTRKEIDCRVKGCALADGEEHCPYSCGKVQNMVCRPHGRLVVRLAELKDGAYQPMSLVANATYKIDTGSDYGLDRIISELDRVADKLRIDAPSGATAWLTGLVGTLSVRNERKRSPEGVTIVPQLHLVFDESIVRSREAEIRRHREVMHGRVIEAETVSQPRQIGMESFPEQCEDDPDFRNVPDDAGGMPDELEDASWEPETAGHDGEQPVQEDSAEEQQTEHEETDPMVMIANEVWEKCADIAADHSTEAWRVLKFFSAIDGSSGISNMKSFFRFADTDAARHEKAMDLLSRTHARIISGNDKFTFGD